MSLNIPGPQDIVSADGYYTRPAEFTEKLEKAKAAFQAQLDDTDGWTSAGTREECDVASKTEDESGVPVVKGTALIENATPEEVIATIQLPGMRRKWDVRFDGGHNIRRFSYTSYQFYSVTKTPSMFVWQRDIGGVQDNILGDDGSELRIVQTSMDDEENLPDAGSYAVSRTRANLEYAGWQVKKQGDDVIATYIVKVHLNGSIPTSVAALVATETPLCVAKVRDTLYSTGFAPYQVTRDSAGKLLEFKSVNITQDFDDGDGSEATAGERKWTSYFMSKGAEEIEIAYDSQRMYPDGVEAIVEGDAATVSVAEAENRVKVSIKEGSEGKRFQVIITPK
ncbi:unnamed protein product [Tilletia laevis]|uniref:START domain-containing protein n=3 Tax=Tilletia TaxID=13289 RepID=A0A8X7T1G4_9BASI|nr:hypothetical protein CF336_g234 [Tilletia laevis]KAE8205847.1 hypothetical protein CF328_g257 [Tilletia controversa]KAE8263013.1 hypothetical protein A4X03_0g2002 [Tilletia caries]KAE8255975.1 hypothetical protein A4X06_0g164 [Tilletia controversa]CAD6886898.1 unnamed protein product [Tilletia caries]